jgi:hypothetical protein
MNTPSDLARYASRPLSGLALWTRVITAIGGVVVSLTLLGLVSIGLTSPTFDLAAVAASAGRTLEPIVLAQLPIDCPAAIFRRRGRQCPARRHEGPKAPPPAPGPRHASPGLGSAHHLDHRRGGTRRRSGWGVDDGDFAFAGSRPEEGDDEAERQHAREHGSQYGDDLGSQRQAGESCSFHDVSPVH